jgi:VWFA-related protein
MAAFSRRRIRVITRRALVVPFLAAVMAAPASPSAQTPRASRDRTIYATVLGRDDAPVTGLGVADFTVREDNVPREVLRVKPAGAPMHIALLVDDSQALEDEAAVADVRASLTAFVKQTLTASPDTQLALITFGGRPTQQLDYTSSASALVNNINRIFGQQTTGAYLLDAIADACKGLTKKGFTDSAIVAFSVERGQEFSNLTHQGVADDLKRAGAALWAVELQGTPARPNASETRERASVLGDVSPESGGMREVAISRIALEGRFALVATRMASRYAITYGRPESLVPPERLDVAVTRRDARILASHWAGQ